MHACVPALESAMHAITKGPVIHRSVQHGRGNRFTRSAYYNTLVTVKNIVTVTPSVEGISVVTLIRTDTTLHHSQKAEKICGDSSGSFWTVYIQY